MTDVLTGLVILVGLVGVVVPILPGTLLIAVAIPVWAALVGGGEPWAYAAAALLALAVGTVVKYVVPGRRLKQGGVPNRTVVLGGLLGIVGFFVVPVVGLVLGFVLGVYLSEVQRVGPQQAWPATVTAMKAVGLSILIELAAGLVATSVWAAGALAT